MVAIRASLVAYIGKESACNAGEPGSIPGLGRPPGEGNGNLLQYSCLENSMDREVWQATVHVVTYELVMAEAINTCTHTHTHTHTHTETIVVILVF